MLCIAKHTAHHTESAMRLPELFSHVDTFCEAFLPQWDQQLRAHGQRVRRRSGQLSMREIMTILISFHQMRFRDFKTTYLAVVEQVLAMLTTVCHVKKARHRTWSGFTTRLAFTLALFNVLIDWDGVRVARDGTIHLSMAQFSL